MPPSLMNGTSQDPAPDRPTRGSLMNGAVPLAPPPTKADAWDANSKAYTDWVAKERADGVEKGLIDPETGWPTKAGLEDAARQLAQSVMMGTTAPGAKGLKLPARAASEDVHEVMQASFPYGRNVGARTVNIDTLNGGVALDNPAQAARIAALKEQMSGPDGYISRPIVDTNGNVVEGQHRLEALRQLGVQKVPVHVIQDLSDGIDSIALHDAIKQAQPMHSDQRSQLMQMLLENVADEGSSAAVRKNYDPPQGYAPAWSAALDYLDGQSASAKSSVKPRK